MTDKPEFLGSKKQKQNPSSRQQKRTNKLDLIGTRSAGLQLAVFAFEDVPMWTGMTHRANPLNERRLRFQKIERVVAVIWYSHCASSVGSGRFCVGVEIEEGEVVMQDLWGFSMAFQK